MSQTTYSAPELRQMARTLQQAKDRDDPRYLNFVHRFAQRTGVSPTGCAEVVRLLASKVAA